MLFLYIYCNLLLRLQASPSLISPPPHHLGCPEVTTSHLLILFHHHLHLDPRGFSHDLHLKIYPSKTLKFYTFLIHSFLQYIYSFPPNELSLSNFNQYAWKMFCLCRLLCSPSCDTLPPPSLANGAPLFWHCQCTMFQQASCSSWKCLTLLLITSSSSSLATIQLCDLSDPVSEWSPLQPAAAWIQNTVLTFSVLLVVWPVSHSAVYSVVSWKSQQWVKALHVDAPGLCFHGHWGPSQLPYCPYTSSLQPLMALWQTFWMYLSPFL